MKLTVKREIKCGFLWLKTKLVEETRIVPEAFFVLDDTLYETQNGVILSYDHSFGFWGYDDWISSETTYILFFFPKNKIFAKYRYNWNCAGAEFKEIKKKEAYNQYRQSQNKQKKFPIIFKKGY